MGYFWATRCKYLLCNWYKSCGPMENENQWALYGNGDLETGFAVPDFSGLPRLVRRAA